jgi:hypothetical protein
MMRAASSATRIELRTLSTASRKAHHPVTYLQEEPTKFYLVINESTAAALKIAIPNLLLGEADKVIE